MKKNKKICGKKVKMRCKNYWNKVLLTKSMMIKNSFINKQSLKPTNCLKLKKNDLESESLIIVYIWLSMVKLCQKILLNKLDLFWFNI